MRPAAPPSLIRTAATGIALGYGALLLVFGLTGRWIVDSAGRPLVVDFLPVYAAGKLGWSGEAARAYDPVALHAVQACLAGHDFAGFLGWHYPPLFFVPAMVLALLPYAGAFLLWTGATAAAFAAVLARIAGRSAAFAGLALPPALGCAIVGQNGFFTAVLFGAFLLFLPKRPLLAGLLLAALAYKPQFGILIPVALIAGGYWRTALTGAGAVLAWIAVAALLAPHSLAAFAHFLPQTSAAVLGEGSAGWFKLQSVYALARLCGADDALGWGLQIAAAFAAAAVLALVWSRRQAPYGLQAAALITAALLATPYVYFYDLPLLAVAFAFLYRAAPFDRMERIAAACTVLLLASYVIWPLPGGFVAAAVILALIARRALAEKDAALLQPA